MARATRPGQFLLRRFGRSEVRRLLHAILRHSEIAEKQLGPPVMNKRRIRLSGSIDVVFMLSMCIIPTNISLYL